MIQRFECKYVVPDSLARRVLHSLRALVVPDPHAVGRPDHTYPICSLYLDSDDLALFRETTEGLRTRFKLRVRVYSDDPAQPALVEIKRRRDGVVHKQRCALSKAQLPMLLSGRALDLPELPPAHRQTIDDFSRLMLSARATPQVLVRYDRQAYVGAFDPSVRVTCDRRLRAAVWRRGDVHLFAAGFCDMPVRGTVLELKFNGRMPSWLLRTVQRFELRRTSFSKYCHAIVAVRGRLRSLTGTT